jgi:hypothetical protein
MKTNLLILLAVMSFHAVSFAGPGAGGGGVTVDVNKHPALRDLVDKTTCEWTTAKDFQNRYVPHSEDVINKIRPLNWYLADSYDREINHIKVCRTHGQLKTIDVADADSVTIIKDESQRQIGIRLNDLIFINMNLFDSMRSQADRDFTFIHEVTHSFIPLAVPRRNESLRSFVKMLSTNFNSSELAVNIEVDHLDMPTTTERLDPYKNQILYAFRPSARFDQQMYAYVKLKPVLKLLRAVDLEVLEGVFTKGYNFVNQCGASDENGNPLSAAEVVNGIDEFIYSNKLDYTTVFTVPDRKTGAIEQWSILTRGTRTWCDSDWRSAARETLDLLLNQKNLQPSLLDLQVLAKAMPGFELVDLLGGFEGIPPDIKSFAKYAAIKIVKKIPNDQLAVYARDSKVRSSNDLMHIIMKKLNAK